MLISELIAQVRVLFNDDISPYRFSDNQIKIFTKEGLREIARLRPDSLMSSTAGYDTDNYDNIYSYVETGNYDETLNKYDSITGWDRDTLPTLYFKATSASVITIYASDAYRTAGTPTIGTISGVDTTGFKKVVATNSSGLAGSVEVTASPTADDKFEVTASERALFSNDMFSRALVNYVVYRLFQVDSDETEDTNRGASYYTMFKRELSEG